MSLSHLLTQVEYLKLYLLIDLILFQYVLDVKLILEDFIVMIDCIVKFYIRSPIKISSFMNINIG